MFFKHLKVALSSFILCAFAHLSADVITANDAEEIQAILDSGNDAALVKGKVYEVRKTILFKHDGQRIFTKGAAGISEYATLRLASFDCLRLIHANTKSNLLLEKVILDGNRYGLKPDWDKRLVDLTFFGGRNGNGHVIRNCVFINPRTWTNIKVHEQANECVVQNCIFIGSGSDVRGNGRSQDEKPVMWGDGITCGASNSRIENNIIIDPTDVGIVLFCATGTIVKKNVISAVSRESLGGINMVDFIPFYEIDKESVDPKDRFPVRKYNYRGTKVENNLIDALGSRIHVGIPVGKTVWVPNKRHLWLYYGGTIQDNTITGNAMGYGIVIAGVTDFTVQGNKSYASYSGYPDSVMNIQPDDPAPFLYDPDQVGTSNLQEDFKPKQRSIMHMLRCNFGPTEKTGPYAGYKLYDYGDKEIKAVVNTAFFEMLERAPDGMELKFYTDYLNDNRLPADEARLMIAKTDEFKKKFGEVDRQNLHLFRTQKWLKAFDEAVGEQTEWDSREIYFKALNIMKVPASKTK